ncbi:hypothetical protein A3SI_14739 [Nitritalea halalkaliphila LW7]|uniref:Outer membrane protein beta-barrel domain-containing protein n=1 Tax=Nitritalea halalkaliphila LW7 TaxID=1189621 RepID=I5BZ50_9BACT|nr:hypothetical protein [Nitritalea halalkaliphila]EIM74852.1 hypothetical protein A3SI_14739 [Nitritalea halalkaliphila LW7]
MPFVTRFMLKKVILSGSSSLLPRRVFGFTSLLLVGLFIGGLRPLLAQDFLVQVESRVGFATGELQREAPGLVMPELSVGFLYQLPELPLELGVRIGYSLYGSKLEERNDLFLNQLEDLRLRRLNYTWNYMGVFRFFPQVYGKVFPFVEVQAGFIRIASSYAIRETAFDEPFERQRDFGTWTQAFQGGGGLMIPFKDPSIGNIEVKLLYQNTARTDFLRRGDVLFLPDPDGERNGIFDFNTRRSALQLFVPTVALSFYL